MKGYKKIGFFFFFFALVNNSEGQKSEKDEVAKLYSIIESFFYGKEWENQLDNRNRPSEFFVQVLSIDSAGKVSRVHLLSEDKNKDSAFFLLNKMEPDHFAIWRSHYYRGKSIFIPISVLTLRDANAKASNFVYDATSLRSKQDGRNAILLNCLSLSWVQKTH